MKKYQPSIHRSPSKVLILIGLAFLLLVNLQAFAAQPKYKLLVFMAEGCPICQYHTLDLKKLYGKYESQNLKIELVFSNALSTRKSIQAFRYKYIMPFKGKRDHKLKKANKWNISTTPEVVLLKDNEVIYRGKISNAFVRIGVRKRVIDEFYLEDALEASIAKKEIAVKETEPVGCLITYPKRD